MLTEVTERRATVSLGAGNDAATRDDVIRKSLPLGR